MSLILVVEPDSRHAAQLASIARNHLHAELVMADSGDRAVAALAHRVPDIVLTAPLLPHRDEAVLSDYLRGLGEAGAHVQTLTIPILSSAAASPRGKRGRFRRERAEPGIPEGCDPALFAEQVGQYLRSARQRRVDVAPAVAEIVPIEYEHEPDIDLTPYLDTIAEPEPVVAQREMPAPPIVLQPEPKAPEPFEPPEPNEHFEPIEHSEPVIDAELVLPPMRASFAKAPSRADMLPVPTRPPVHAAHVPQVIAVPTTQTEPGPATVNVAVAVSVQVAAAPPASGVDHRWGPASAGPAEAATRNSKRPPKPVQDEWGFFDPDQCGFRALLARLDAIAAKEEED
jgi:CheY-like chemotaxis protein